MSSTKILIINNYGQFCHLIHRAIRDLGIDNQLVENTLSAEEILEKEPYGLILSGGPTMGQIGNCMKYVHEVDVPILGICLGHQLMAKAFGGEVRKGKHGEYAEVLVEILYEDDILKGLSPTTNTWTSHADEVGVLPENFIRLARSDICENEAMKHVERPLYGVQWHPEVSHTVQGTDLFKNFLEVCRSR